MYKIDRKNLKKEKSFQMTFFYAGLFFFLIFTYVILGSMIGLVDGDFEGNPIFILIFVWLFTGFFMYSGIKGAKKVKEKNKMYDYLEVHGKLVKGLKYQMQPTGKRVNDRPIYMIVAKYKLESGSVVELHGDAEFDGKFADEDGLVDALIDPNNPENHYLDFNREECSNESYDYNNPIS